MGQVYTPPPRSAMDFRCFATRQPQRGAAGVAGEEGCAEYDDDGEADGGVTGEAEEKGKSLTAKTNADKRR